MEVEQPLAYAVTKSEYEVYLLEVFDLTIEFKPEVEPPAVEGM